MSITPEQKRLVVESWKMVAPMADAAAEIFYQRLFELDPDLRELFQYTDMKEQSRKLMQMLAAAVKGLDHLEELVPAVRKLGQRHAGYGVKESHYGTVGAALLWTLEKGLGDAFTTEVRDAWSQVYTVLASVMKEAASEAVPA